MDRVNFAVVAKSPIDRILKFARSRDWRHLPLLSSSKNSYNADYHSETGDGDQLPAVNVFVKRDGRIHHFYNTEMIQQVDIRREEASRLALGQAVSEETKQTLAERMTDCLFDVRITGNIGFAKIYGISQQLRIGSTTRHCASTEPCRANSVAAPRMASPSRRA